MNKLANRIIIAIIVLIMILFLGYLLITRVTLSLPVNKDELIVNYSENKEEIQIYIGKEKCIIRNLIVSEEENKIVIELKGTYYPNSAGYEGVAKDKISIKGKDKIVVKSILGQKEIYHLEH